MDRTDRNRLQQVQQTDLTESRLNEDFLYWLKNSGPNWLLGVLAIIAGILLYNRWSEHKSQRFDKAWSELAGVEGALPASLEEVANDPASAKAGSVRHVARLAAADAYLQAVQSRRPVAVQDAAATLSEEDRGRYLDQADRLYEQVATETTGSRELTILAVNALFGRAAAHESKGNVDQARTFYDQAATLAGERYPDLAADARQRGQSIDQFAQLVQLPKSSDLPSGSGQAPPRQPADVDPTVLSLIRSSLMVP